MGQAASSGGGRLSCPVAGCKVHERWARSRSYEVVAAKTKEKWLKRHITDHICRLFGLDIPPDEVDKLLAAPNWAVVNYLKANTKGFGYVFSLADREGRCGTCGRPILPEDVIFRDPKLQWIHVTCFGSNLSQDLSKRPAAPDPDKGPPVLHAQGLRTPGGGRAGLPSCRTGGDELANSRHVNRERPRRNVKGGKVVEEEVSTY